MKHFIFCVTILISAHGWTQNTYIDSLKTALRDQIKQDTIRLNTLVNLSYEYDTINPEEGLRMSNEAIHIADSLNNKSYLGLSYRNKAYNLTALSKDSLAIEAYNESIDIFKKLNHIKLAIKAFHNKGLIHHKRNEYVLALQSHDSALVYARKLKDTFLMAHTLNSKGINEMNLTLYKQATESYLEVLILQENLSSNKQDRVAEAHNNLGLLKKRMGEYDVALENYSKALNIALSQNYVLIEANCYTNIGAVYDEKQQHRKAIFYYNKSLNLMTQLKNEYGIASAITNTGIAFINLKKYDSAQINLEKSIKFWDALNNITNLTVAHNSLGELYLELAKEDQNRDLNLSKAISNFNTAHDYANDLNDLKRLYTALENRSQAFFELGNYRNAYDDILAAYNTKEQFLSNEKRREIAQIEAKHEFLKRDRKRIAEQEKISAIKDGEIKRQKLIRNYSLISGIMILLFGTVGFMLYRKKQIQKEKTMKAEFDLAVSDSELKVLRNQMSPHFISNSLSSINDYISRNDIDSATNYLIKFSKLMRAILENTQEQEIPLEDEISILKTYMDIEQKRFNNSFTYEFHIDNEIEIDNISIPPMILQPFVENSIIHGFSNIGYLGKIDITYGIENEMLICSVEDNGIGSKSKFLKEKSNINKSMSLEITEGRKKILNKLKNTNA